MGDYGATCAALPTALYLALPIGKVFRRLGDVLKRPVLGKTITSLGFSPSV